MVQVVDLAKLAMAVHTAASEEQGTMPAEKPEDSSWATGFTPGSKQDSKEQIAPDEAKEKREETDLFNTGGLVGVGGGGAVAQHGGHVPHALLLRRAWGGVSESENFKTKAEKDQICTCIAVALQARAVVGGGGGLEQLHGVPQHGAAGAARAAALGAGGGGGGGPPLLLVGDGGAAAEGGEQEGWVGLGVTSSCESYPSLESTYWPTPSGTAARAFPSGAVVPAHTPRHSQLLVGHTAGVALYSNQGGLVCTVS